MIETIEKRKITPVLMEMKLNGEEKFPVDQLDSINTTIQRLQTKHIFLGLKWSAKKCDEGYNVLVTRIA